MLCLTCGYHLGSAQESDKEENREGKAGIHYGPKRGPICLERVPGRSGRTERRAEAWPVAHVGNAGLYRAAQKAITGLLFAGSLFAAEPALQSRIVQVEKQDIVPIYSTYNYSTTIVLLDKEEVME